MTGRRFWPALRAGGVIFVLALAGAVYAAMAQAAQQHEVPPVLRASEILPSRLLQGPFHRVSEVVYNNGFLNRYEVNTTHGKVTVVGTHLLRMRLSEVEALQRMEEFKRSKAFGDSFKRAVKAPIQGAKALLTEPVETVSNTVKGVGTFFRNVGHSLFGGPSEHEEGTVKRVLGFDTLKRKFAYEFGVDPYTSYPPVRQRLDEITWSALAGGLAVKVALSAVPGPAGGAVRAPAASRNLSQLVRDKTPAELKKVNAGRLTRMGVHASLAEVFLEHPKLSPTRKTHIVGALQRMTGVADRAVFIQRATLDQDEFMALFRQRQAELMAGYHNKVGRVARMVKLGQAPFLQRPDGVIVGLFPVDHISWTEQVAVAVGAALDAIGNRPEITGGELWFEGTLSPLARRSFEAQKWVVHEKVATRLDLD